MTPWTWKMLQCLGSWENGVQVNMSPKGVTVARLAYVKTVRGDDIDEVVAAVIPQVVASLHRRINYTIPETTHPDRVEVVRELYEGWAATAREHLREVEALLAERDGGGTCDAAHEGMMTRKQLLQRIVSCDDGFNRITETDWGIFAESVHTIAELAYGIRVTALGEALGYDLEQMCADEVVSLARAELELLEAEQSSEE